MWFHLDARDERGTSITSQGRKVQSEKAAVLLKARRSRESEDGGRFHRNSQRCSCSGHVCTQARNKNSFHMQQVTSPLPIYPPNRVRASPASLSHHYVSNTAIDQTVNLLVALALIGSQ